MRLRSTRAQTVRVGGLDLVVEFAAGEEMRTEISAKFRRERLEESATEAGLRIDRWWTDEDGDFVLSLVRPAL
jgi:L-histidine N-alpha-methyltransferase